MAEERLNYIVRAVNESGSCTVQRLMQELDASESTVRRDLALLAQERRLIKVRGGAVSLENRYHTKDIEVSLRMEHRREEKESVARYAATLIEPEDFVYLDAGTTTELMLDYLTEKPVVFVTNSVRHAKKLSQAGYETYLPGGEFKWETEAIVGEEAVESLTKYNFTKGFFGTNGVSDIEGFSTPDVREAMVKRRAMGRCRECFVLCDDSKFTRLSSVSFANFLDATVITNRVYVDSYRGYHNIVETETIVI